MKSRLQAGHAKYKSAVDGVLSIIKHEGIGGIYKGVGNKLLQSVLTAAILFVGQKKIYEVIKKVGALFFRVYQRSFADDDETLGFTGGRSKKN